MFNPLNFITKFIKSNNQKELERIGKILKKINLLEDEFKDLNDLEFPKKTLEYKEKLKQGKTLDDILPEAFALVREASKRTRNERHFDVQIIGGVALHEGKIAEMRTGEGKTLTITLAAYLNALCEKGVHIVTVNDYLANRDSKWMGKVYDYLGLKTGCIISNLEDSERKKNYLCDITYATNNELGFDYLRDNMKYDFSEIVQRNHNFCIVDEVDSILIDESRTPLIISGKVEDKSNLYLVADEFIKKLDLKDFEIDKKNKNSILTDKGVDKIEKLANQRRILKNNNFYDPENLNLVHHINQALRANHLFMKDTDYIIRDQKIQIIDEFTGRVLDGRRYSDGLHQAIEAKENVEIQEENQTLASTTYQNYFRLYKKLSGMTGTALTESEEFYDIYRLNVISIPTHQKMVRKDYNDQIFRTTQEKYEAIKNKIIECNSKGQPVLVGTTSIEKSEKISEFLKNIDLKHNVLNAKHHELEAKIIAEAGKVGSVTIATNMAGRGTDIKLGGQNFSLENGNSNIKIEDNEKVKNFGGLFIIGTERHESRRIDNQLRGRSGRQGDPGSSIFYISLEDELMRIFGGDQIDGILKKLGLKKNESINHPWINKAMERAQKRVEGRNFDIRKTLIKFDDVMNDQRQVIFNQRINILKGKDINETILSFQNEIKKYLLSIKLDFEKSQNQKKYLTSIKEIIGNVISDKDLLDFSNIDKDSFIKKFEALHESKRTERINKIGEMQNNELEKRIFLQIIDFNWRSHLQYLEQLRQVIGLRSYGQKDPLSEFKKEAFTLFENLLKRIKNDLIKFLLNINIVISENNKKDEENDKLNDKSKKVGRNEKCPCGSGKKFKFCCGNI